MLQKIQQIEGGVCAPQGFLASGVHCGIRKNKSKKDLALVYSAKKAAAAAVYTQNRVKGAPLVVTKAHLKDASAQAVIVNSGNANTCNLDGEEKALAMCALAAKTLGLQPEDVLVASTGVIGQVLPIEPIQTAMPALAAALSETGGSDAAEAIMTTDTHKKEIAVTFSLSGKVCKMGGMAKGSGMIHPNMATLLCFLTTDANVSPALLQQALSDVTRRTFNMVSIDGDTSTNDMVILLANGAAGNAAVKEAGEDYETFVSALETVMTALSKEIAADGEGATKLLECRVTGAADADTARSVAKSVISSSLFKAAMFGEDANWGRILCAVGYAQGAFCVEQVDVALASENGEIPVCKNGRGLPFSEETAAKILKADEIGILISLGDGSYSATAWGCDLTYDYVKINGDYRT